MASWGVGSSFLAVSSTGCRCFLVVSFRVSILGMSVDLHLPSYTSVSTQTQKNCVWSLFFYPNDNGVCVWSSVVHTRNPNLCMDYYILDKIYINIFLYSILPVDTCGSYVEKACLLLSLMLCSNPSITHQFFFFPFPNTLYDSELGPGSVDSIRAGPLSNYIH